jgi:hypothetical protein
MATGKRTTKKQKSPERRIKGAAEGFPRGRLIWARLFEPESMEEGQNRSFSCAIRFDEDADLDALRAGFKAACVDQFGSSKMPRRGHSCFIEGDELAELIEDEKVPLGTTEGMVILKLRRYEKYGPPQLWDQNVEEIESPTEMYSGCHVIGDVEFYGWERTTGSGVSCVLNGLQKVREDEPLGGGKNDTEDSFSRVKMKGGKDKGGKSKDDEWDMDRKERRDDDDDRPSRSSRRSRDRSSSHDDVI